jgi:hypothetical protein
MLPLILAVAVTACTTAAQVSSVTIQPRRDAVLYEDPNGFLANGGGNYLFAGRTVGAGVRRTVIYFDIAANVPAGSQILDATLDMFVSRSVWSQSLDVTLHRVTDDWNEGPSVATGQEGGGTAAQSGDVTWLDRNRGVSTWTNPGGDYVATPSGVCSTPQTGPCRWSGAVGMTIDAQNWLAQPATNYGWLLRTDENDPQAVRRFDSRENFNAANRPSLTILFVPPGQAGNRGFGCGSPSISLQATGTLAAGGNLTLTSQGTTGQLAAHFLTGGFNPVPVTLAPGCDLYVDPAQAATPGFGLFDAAGQFANSFPLPNTAAMQGLIITAQTASLQNASPGFALSNAVVVVNQ